jgi:hypothetical protein
MCVCMSKYVCVCACVCVCVCVCAHVSLPNLSTADWQRLEHACLRCQTVRHLVVLLLFVAHFAAGPTRNDYTNVCVTEV